MSSKSGRSQAALEYLTTYSWVILIIAIVAVLFYLYIKVPSTLPSSCTFISGFYCTDIVLQSNAITHNTLLTVALSNAQAYAIANPKLFVSISAANTTTFACSPNFVLPGGGILCTANVPISTNLGTLLAGDLYLNATYCGLLGNYIYTGNCIGAPRETYHGTFTGHTEAQISTTSTLTLNALNATQYANNAKDPITATVKLNGYPVEGATVNFTVNSIAYTISPALINTNSFGMALSYVWGTTIGSVLVTAKYASLSNSITIQFVAAPSTGTTTSSIPTVPTVGTSLSTTTTTTTTTTAGTTTTTIAGCSASPNTYNTAGGPYTVTVPANCNSVMFQVSGAAGYGGTYGGAGGYISGNYAVTPGNTLYVYVGGAGQSGSGGTNGGGSGTFGGGGCSAVSSAASISTGTIIVAAGGGGYGSSCGGSGCYPFTGGGGGGTSGATSYGYGATQASPGAGSYTGQPSPYWGAWQCNYNWYWYNYAESPGSAGSYFQGGTGYGGGGCGYYGGGGGGQWSAIWAGYAGAGSCNGCAYESCVTSSTAGGGGGGSSWSSASVSGVTNTQGGGAPGASPTGNVILTWFSPPQTTTTSTSTTSTSTSTASTISSTTVETTSTISCGDQTEICYPFYGDEYGCEAVNNCCWAESYAACVPCSC